MEPSVVSPGARLVIEALEDAGFEAWLVGGAVRDGLLGRPASDADVASSALWPQAAEALRRRGVAVHETGTAHGTVTAVVQGEPVEVTTFRSDGTYSDGRRPDEVRFVGSIEEDLARRDFTVNAMAYHPQRGLCDPFGGQRDVLLGVIRAVGDPAARFSEDGLRVLRACRFCAQLGFTVEDGTLAAMRSCKSMVLNVATERVTDELNRLLTAPSAGKALLETWDVLAVVLPELVAMEGLDQRNPHHCYDVLAHTARVVDGVAPNALDRWLALLHDVAKPAAFFVDEKGVGHFYGHGRLGQAMAGEVLGRFCFSRAFVDDVCRLVAIHDDATPTTEKGAARLVRSLGGRFDLARALLGLRRADGLAQAAGGAQRAEAATRALELLDAVRATGEPVGVGQLAIDGNDVMACGLAQGPQVGAVLRELLDQVMEGSVPNRRDDLLALVRAQGKEMGR